MELMFACCLDSMMNVKLEARKRQLDEREKDASNALAKKCVDCLSTWLATK